MHTKLVSHVKFKKSFMHFQGNKGYFFTKFGTRYAKERVLSPHSHKTSLHEAMRLISVCCPLSISSAKDKSACLTL